MGVDTLPVQKNMKFIPIHLWMVKNWLNSWRYVYHLQITSILYSQHGQRYSKLQKKRARNPVPICPFNQLQPADRPLAGWGCLKGHFGTELRARFSSAWSNVECGCARVFRCLQNADVDRCAWVCTIVGRYAQVCTGVSGISFQKWLQLAVTVYRILQNFPSYVVLIHNCDDYCSNAIKCAD